MLITFVRHTSVDVPSGTCYGRTDVPLKDSFTMEAEVVKRLTAPNHYDAVYTSPLSRCVRLADYCGFTDAIRDERITELDFGVWEMKPFDEIKDPLLADWYTDWINVAPGRGESFRQQLNRFESFLAELRTKRLKNILVFTHAGILACARVAAGDCEITQAFKNITAFGSILKLEFLPSDL